jgi:hypothetical protein
MPFTYARNTQQTPINASRTTLPLGYSDQLFNSSKDHLQELKDYKNQIEGTIQRAEQPYVSKT